MRPAQSVQHRLILFVSLGLMAFALAAGALVYRLSYQHELDDAMSLERQIVRTIQSQAEVALFALNPKIAEDLIDGLRANPRIRAARIAQLDPGKFNVSAGFGGALGSSTLTEYPLYSPVNSDEKIGVLVIARNDTVIQADAMIASLQQVLWVLLQTVATALLIMLFFRHLIGKPLAQLANRLAGVEPGQAARIEVAPRDRFNEIGSLAESANALIEAAETALAKVHALAVTDDLTGLSNRRAFMARLEEEVARVQRYDTAPSSVLMLDLDHFKQINDRHGHASGDAVLRDFSLMLSAQLRKVDLAGRIGGEEFAILLPDTGLQEAGIFAERLRQRVADAVTVQGDQRISYTVSIGIAEIVPGDQRADNPLARADHALYAAKQGGRNRVVTEDLLAGAAKA